MTEYKEQENWFKQNLVAVPTGMAGGCCGACIFRQDGPIYCNKYCNKLACTYIVDSDYLESVYWIARDAETHQTVWPELVKFFDETPKQNMRKISYSILTRAVLAKKSGKSI